MNLQELLKFYAECKKIKETIIALKSEVPTILHLKGLVGSLDSIIVAALHNHIIEPQLFILPNKETAAYFLNDLENLVGEKYVLFFPDSYRQPYNLDEINNANVLLRAEVLNRIIKRNNKLLIVTYPEALHEKVVTKKNLIQNTIDIKAGEKISIDFITDFLREYHFEQTDFVVEAGQFSIRGGIVDIFSFANELPYRIEFLGDQIDSIRTFNPLDQLSVEKLNYVTIIPNVQTSLLQEGRESLLEFIPSNTKIWIKETQTMLFTIKEGIDKLTQAEESSNKKKDFFDTDNDILERLKNKTVVEFGGQFYFKPQLSFEYNISPQPSFNKNFDLLVENLNSNSGKGFTNIIFSDTAKQIERIYAILEDLSKKNQSTGDKKINFSTALLSLHEGFIDKELKLACYTDHQIFDRYHRFRLKQSYSKSQAITLKELQNLKPGDYITHIDHGIGKYAGLERIEVNGKPQEAIRLVYKDNDILYVSIHSLHRIAKYSGKEGTVPSMNKLGSNAWANLKQKTKKKVKDIAKDLIQLYAKRKAQKGFAFSPDTYLQNELEASFIYEDTPDQIKATRDVKEDMEQSYPMDRLICGDVGFGKTEIAIRAAFKAVADNKQVAVLVPTTILALQHHTTFKERLKDFPCNIDYINRFKSSKEQHEVLQKLEQGKLDIIIGTHRLLGKDIKFKDLGLLIVDEEQKFGVAAKEKLKSLRVNVDTLTLTATPIPRTLQFSLMGARDLSIINTPPPNRFPVTTELHLFNEKIIKEAIEHEVQRGGQVFFVHNRVQNIHEIADMVQRLCPDTRVSVGHGQMDGDKLENVLLNFIEGSCDVLVATTIIESGLDISNANTIIINQAQIFGLSDLHQMRGRVGRSNKKAFCYLLTPPLSVLTPEARQRLKAIEEFSDLGSGFNISMRDLDIRGAGNLLGGEQSGFIAEIGFEMYHKILDEAIQELKESDFKELFVEEKSDKEKTLFINDCQIDTDLEILIPDYYVNNITERLNLYKELDNISINDETKLNAFENALKDRFGAVPRETLDLINTIRLRWVAIELGFEKLILKNQKLIGYFISKQDSPFYQSSLFSSILHFVQNNPKVCRMREGSNKLSLSFDNIYLIDAAMIILKKLKSRELVKT